MCEMIPTRDPWQSNAGNGYHSPTSWATCHNQFLLDYLQYSQRSTPSNNQKGIQYKFGGKWFFSPGLYRNSIPLY